MIIVILTEQRNERTGQLESVISHGIATATDRRITLPNVPPFEVGARFSDEIGEWVLPS